MRLIWQAQNRLGRHHLPLAGVLGALVACCVLAASQGCSNGTTSSPSTSKTASPRVEKDEVSIADIEKIQLIAAKKQTPLEAYRTMPLGLDQSQIEDLFGKPDELYKSNTTILAYHYGDSASVTLDQRNKMVFVLGGDGKLFMITRVEQGTTIERRTH